MKGLLRALVRRAWIPCLIAAGGITALWAWSYLSSDQLMLQLGPSRPGVEPVAYFVSQDSGRIEFAITSVPGEYVSWPVYSGFSRYAPGETSLPFYRQPLWGYGGFGVGSYALGYGPVIRAVAIPHWFVLTLLLAVGWWSRRRQKAQRSRGFEVEPVSEGGVSASGPNF